MTALRIVLGLVAWIVAAFPVAVVIGIAIRHAADRQRAEAQQRHPSAQSRPEWSQVAVESEFTALIPSMVTADVFVLDAMLNRRARGAA